MNEHPISKVNFLTVPKAHCDATNTATTADMFVIALASGEDVKVYVLTPEHAKKLAQILARNVVQYETTYRKIPEFDQSVPSPFQGPDLSNPPGGKGKK